MGSGAPHIYFYGQQLGADPVAAEAQSAASALAVWLCGREPLTQTSCAPALGIPLSPGVVEVGGGVETQHRLSLGLGQGKEQACGVGGGRGRWWLCTRLPLGVPTVSVQGALGLEFVWDDKAVRLGRVQ